MSLVGVWRRRLAPESAAAATDSVHGDPAPGTLDPASEPMGPTIGDEGDESSDGARSKSDGTRVEIPPMEGYGRVAAVSLLLYADSSSNLLALSQISKDGRFTIDLESQCNWRFRIWLTCGHTVFESPELVIQEGETLAPASLQEIDLGQVGRTELRVLGPDLRPAGDVRVRSTDGASLDEQTDSSGMARAVLCGGVHGVRLSKASLRSTESTLQHGFQEIELKWGYLVRLVLEPKPDVEPGWVLGATPFEHGKAVPGRILEFDATGLIETRMPRLGDYPLEWPLRVPGRHVPKMLGRIDGATHSITISDTEEAQEIRISIPESALAAAIQELDRDGW